MKFTAKELNDFYVQAETHGTGNSNLINAARDITFQYEQTRRKFSRIVERCHQALTNAEEAVHRNGRPNSCGILQGSASELEVTNGQLDALKDAAETIQKAVVTALRIDDDK